MSKLWFGEADLKIINNWPKNHIGAFLGIEFTELGDDYIKATMPVNERTHQPFGILHGGASVVLAESLGSIASWLIVDPEKYMAVGLDVNANHLRSVKSGLVTGICTPINIGGKIHVWDIKIYDDREKLVCISRLTVAIIPKI
jgi:1,4-dihydroxy-2-naphthoyl-CoA hydrolase